MKNPEQLIRECSWFDNVPEDGLSIIIKTARIKHFENSKYLYRLDEKTEFIYAVISGFVRIKISSIEGQEFAITEFSNDTWFGEYSLTGKPVRMFEAQVLENSSILEIPKASVKSLAEQYPVIYKNLFVAQSEHTLRMSELLSGMLFYPLSARVAGRLIWFAQNFGRNVDDGVLINKKMSQQELADLTLGSRQRVNKALKSFESLGLIAISGQQYLVKDMAALKEQTQLTSEE